LRRQTKRLNLKKIAVQACQRKLGIGADGLLVLEKSQKASVKMRIFNADGSEAEMCGNGARCVAYYLQQVTLKQSHKIKIDTKAGILNSQTHKGDIEINMTVPRGIRLNSILSIRGHSLRFNFINTGVPHTVMLCEGIEQIDVPSLGRLIRFHKRFKPAGTNVNFVEPVGLDRIKIRTYERGVEGETLACGTGSVAAAIIYALKLRNSGLAKEGRFDIVVDTASGEALSICFHLHKNKISNVWLRGKARIICEGDCYV
jgi:diaminopimelate epimerase